MHRKVNTKSATKFQSWVSANRPFRNRAGPVVRRPINIDPGLNFNPFFFVLFKSIFSENQRPITKLQAKGILRTTTRRVKSVSSKVGRE